MNLERTRTSIEIAEIRPVRRAPAGLPAGNCFDHYTKLRQRLLVRTTAPAIWSANVLRCVGLQYRTAIKKATSSEMRKIGKARLRLSYLFLGLLAVAACDNGTEPRVPTRIEIASGDGQTAQVATVVAAPPTVRVLDRKSKPVRGVNIVFTVTAGGGSVTTTNATTDANGRAQAIGWTLGTAAGLNTLTATSPAILNVSTVFSATGGAAAPAKLQVSVQPASSAQNRIPLPTQPTVQVVDQYGNPVSTANVIVSAQVAGVTLQNAQVSSDANGAATFSALTLAGKVGTYTLRFSAASFPAIDATTPTVLGAGTATRLLLGVGFPATTISGNAFAPTPIVEVTDPDDNLVTTESFTVSVRLESGTGTLSGGAPVVTQGGRATFGSLSYAGTGAFRLRFTSPGLNDVVTTDLMSQAAGACTTTLALNFALGQMTRFSADQPNTPQCLQFDLAANRDQQYLVLFESDPATGDYGNALFPGIGNPSSGITVSLTAAGSGALALARTAARAERQLPAGMLHSWDFGAGAIYEYQPPQPVAGVPGPSVLQRGRQLSLNSASVEPRVGDTIVVYLANIDRLNIPAGNQFAVIRHISNELIIAEDTRLGTLTRQNGSTNQPLTVELMDSIAQAYAAESKRQGDMLFNGRFNSTTEAQSPARIIAVHTLMPADNVWGYTYSSTNTFAWDFWVGTNGSTRGPNQHVLRNAHNLFMHEIVHTRHWGLIERSGQPAWGNLWLIEGFARFSERLPIASYLLRTPDPSRTSNLVLPFYSEWAPSYFRDDVPTYLNATSSFLGGYQQSSYIFDYLADQVAAAGGNWRTALTTFLTAAGSESALDAAVNSLLPGLTFRSLLTRARIALYTDDLGPALPPWTQYLQYQLRASRPPGASGTPVDPRTLFPRVVPGTSYSDVRLIVPGAAWGYLIDGVAATNNARITLTFPTTAETGISITRVR